MTPADKFHEHVDGCSYCRDVKLCTTGRELLLKAAGHPTVMAVTEQLQRHEDGDIEATLWLRSNAPKIAALFVK